jgi:hypothetical protein
VAALHSTDTVSTAAVVTNTSLRIITVDAHHVHQCRVIRAQSPSSLIGSMENGKSSCCMRSQDVQCVLEMSPVSTHGQAVQSEALALLRGCRPLQRRCCSQACCCQSNWPVAPPALRPFRGDLYACCHNVCHESQHGPSLARLTVQSARRMLAGLPAVPTHECGLRVLEGGL